MKNLKTFEDYKHDVNINNVPDDIQEEYDDLLLRLMDGNADPDPFYVENRVDQIRKQYPDIKSDFS